MTFKQKIKMNFLKIKKTFCSLDADYLADWAFKIMQTVNIFYNNYQDSKVLLY